MDRRLSSSKSFGSNIDLNPQNLQYQQSNVQNQDKPSTSSMFRFANKFDYLLMIVGSLGSMIGGAALPLFALFWGEMIDNFRTPQGLVDQTYKTLLQFIYVGLVVLVFGWIMLTCWAITGQRQSKECKKAYLQSILKQQMGWFDTSNQFQISSQFSLDTSIFQSAIGQSFPFVFNVLGMMISGVAVSFSKGWLMALVMIISLPLITMFKYLYSKLIVNREKKQQAIYSEAGGRAEQVFYAIKTVKMLNGEPYEQNKYNKLLEKCQSGMNKYALLLSISLGGAMFLMINTLSFGLWYGSHCVQGIQGCREDVSHQLYSIGTAFTIFFSLMIVSFHLSHLPENFKKIFKGLLAVQRMSRIIDREPSIKNSANGIRIENFKGNIKFHNVTFSYPKDPSKKILNGLSLEINKNKNALVGESGCGKSTIFQLIMRFYDPEEGKITVDGYNLKDLDLVWWRSMIGYVGQEPVLFATSIKENLLFLKKDATDIELQNALKRAEAFQFVNQLQKKMDTYVGSGGGQLSGGQKQRIAIARAILRNPKILILDQATSALDRKNQILIQDTLNRISEGVISISIAHRTKTIVNSDQIFVIQKGKLKESGRIRQLITFEAFKEEDQQNIGQSMKQQIKNDEQLIFVNQQISPNTLKQTQNLTNETKQVKNPYKKMFAFMKGNTIMIIFCAIFSGIIGAAFPVISIFLVNIIQELFTHHNQDISGQVNKNALIVSLIAVLELFCYIGLVNLQERIGQRVTTKVRSKTFEKLIKLPVSWHEKLQNNVSAVCSKLSVGCSRIKEITTISMFFVAEIIICLLSGIAIGFVFQWRTALIQLAFFPIQMVTAGFTSKYRNGKIASQSEEEDSIGKINEAVTNIRTVYSLGYEQLIEAKYIQTLEKPQKSNRKRAILSGFLYGLGESLIFVLISVLFHLSSYFVRDNGVEAKNVFIVIFSMFFSTIKIGEISNILPNIVACIQSSKEVLKILETTDEQQKQVLDNSKMIRDKKIQGNILLQNIKFKYQTRSQYLFNNFNLQIPYGQKIAFVGASGCGKSSIMAFLLRFQQPESGEIIIDGVNIKDYDIHYLRSQFGVVSQEPVLFSTSFKENIIYNMENVRGSELIECARKANALGFITQNYSKYKKWHYTIEQQIQNMGSSKTIVTTVKPYIDIEAFDTGVGIKGSHISGGQKQRVAIARAILRNPNILLLDEATSALDRENQMKVQKCLDQIMTNKSCITIAHRIDTIKNSNLIFVFERGRVIEKGDYDQLMERKGYFSALEKGIQMI